MRAWSNGSPRVIVTTRGLAAFVTTLAGAVITLKGASR